MKTRKEILLVGLISFIVGGMIADPIISLEKGAWLSDLLKSSFVGLMIGIAARFAFRYFYINVKHKTFLSFSAVQLLIGVGTILSAYMLGVRNFLYFLIMILPAEIIGFVATYSMYHYNLKLNQGLEDTQRKYKP